MQCHHFSSRRQWYLSTKVGTGQILVTTGLFRSLTPILMKIREKIVREKMVAFLSENNLFNPNQHGFMKGRSCLSALLSVYDEIILNLYQTVKCPVQT